MKKLYLALIFGILFSLSFISGAGFDNRIGNITIEKNKPLILGGTTLQYNVIWEKYTPIKIDNFFGLGATIAEGAIIKHTESCANDCESEIFISTYEDDALIDSIKFYTLTLDDKGKEIDRQEQAIRSYDIYYANNRIENEVNDYEYSCVGSKNYYVNGTEIQTCSDKLIGSHIEYSYNWMKYKEGQIVPAGKYWIKINGDKRADRTVDWIISTQGKDINEWSIWGSIGLGLNTNLIAYYPLSNGTDVATGKHNLTTTSSTFATGKIGNALYNSYANAIDSIVNDINISSNTNFSLCLWTNGTTDGTSYGIIGLLDAKTASMQAGNDMLSLMHASSGSAWQYFLGGQTNGGLTKTGKYWQYHCLVYNGNKTLDYYNNGTKIGSVTVASGWNAVVDEILIGAQNDAGLGTWNGSIDEVGLWSRALSNVEVSELYNSGNGLSYTSFGTVGGSTINLISPNDAVITSNLNVQFNCSANITVGSPLKNISLWTNQTGTWAIRNYTTTNGAIMTLGLSDDTVYKWSCSACDTDNDCGYANENRTFKITQSGFDFGLCNSSLTNVYANFTFKDETSLLNINSSVNAITLGIYPSDNITNIKNVYVVSPTENPSYAFCSNTVGATLNIINGSSIRYYSTNYPARTSSLTGTLTEATSSRVLYSLSLTDGIYVTFITTTTQNTVISGATIDIMEEVGATNLTVGQGITGSDGAFTIFLNPDYLHVITASKVGYGSTTQTIYPTQSTYTIVIPTSGNTQYISNADGLLWGIYPSIGILNGSQEYFGFNVSSTKNNLVKCKIDLLDINKTTILATAETNTTNVSFCSVQTLFNPSSVNDTRFKGRLSIDIGDGYQILEEDAYWIKEDIDTTGMTFTDWFTSLKNFDLSYFNNNEQHREYTNILIFFLIVMVICAVLNNSGWDIQTQGGMIFLVGFFVWGASIAGFLNLSNISPINIIDKYFVAIIYSMFMIGFGARSMQ